MFDQVYQFSRWIYSVMEGFFNWIWSLLTSGRLDYVLENWLGIAILISIASFVIDMLFYYLREGKETLAVKAVLFIYEGIRKLIYKASGKEYAPPEDADDYAGYADEALATEPSTYEYDRITNERHEVTRQVGGYENAYYDNNSEGDGLTTDNRSRANDYELEPEIISDDDDEDDEANRTF